VQGLVPKPIDQVQPVAGFQYVADRVFGSKRHHSFRDRKKEDVVVTEHDADGRSERTDVAKHAEGIRPAVDEIADEPQSIYRGVEANMLNEALQGIMASLHIADCVCRHKKGCQRSMVIKSRKMKKTGFRCND
jgi:hypothetical protein